MIRYKSVGWMTLVLIGLVGSSVSGQDEGAAELYGRGVHAYFAADYELAVKLLSQSIEKHGLDPRCYYFRGLAQASMQGMDAGLADFAQGADVEINHTDRPVYDINGALQRVQGSLRLELEKVRAATRKAAVERKKKRDRVRYEALKRCEDIVLFDPNRPAPQVKLDLPTPDLGGQPDPFDSGMAFSGGKQVANVVVEPVQPSGELVMPADTGQLRDPFAARGAEVKQPAETADPFGAAEPAAKPPTTAKPPVPKPPADPNPFGENLPKLDLPVEEKPVSPAANIGSALINMLGKTLSGTATDRDPFGDAEQAAPAKAAPAEEAPAKETPAIEEPAETTDDAPPLDDEASATDPVDAGASKKGEAQEPAAQDADPFK